MAKAFSNEDKIGPELQNYDLYIEKVHLCKQEGPDSFEEIILFCHNNALGRSTFSIFMQRSSLSSLDNKVAIALYKSL